MTKLRTERHGEFTHYFAGKKRHRPNGPAWVSDDGQGWSWWMHGNGHRYYGPAYYQGTWYLHGEVVK